MSPVNLNDLGGKLGEDVDFANLPSQGGSMAPPPPPAPYRFQLPKNLDLSHFDTVASEKHGQRVKVTFGDSNPLVIVQALPGLEKEWLKTPFKTNLSNVPRPRGREKVLVSDLDYLLKALKKVPAPGTVRTNRWFIEQLIAAAKAEMTFGSTIEWSWNCSDQRDAYFLTATPEEQQAPGFSLQTAETTIWEVDAAADDDHKNKKGCGARAYQSDVVKVGGEYPLRILCPGKDNQPSCGSIVRGFANLTKFIE